MKIDIDIKKLIEKIYIHPKSENWYKNLVIELVKRLGFDFEIEKSDLESEILIWAHSMANSISISMAISMAMAISISIFFLIYNLCFYFLLNFFFKMINNQRDYLFVL